jgi:hypothetical protein
MADVSLVVGTAGGLFRVGAGGLTKLDGREVHALAHSGGAWWAVFEAKDLEWSTDLARWKHVATVEGRRALSLLAAGADVFVGTSEAHLLHLRGGRLETVEGFEKTPGRKTWNTPWGGPPDTRSISATADGVLLVNVHVGGVARSTDWGRSFEPTMDIGADCHQVLAHPKEPLLAYAATALGLGVSDDAGRTWSFRREGLHATYGRAVAVGRDYGYASFSRSERGQEAAVYRFPLRNGGKVERLTKGLPRWFADNVNTACLAARDRLVALGTVDGRVYLSRDQGGSWQELAHGLERARAVAFEAGSQR